MMSVRVCVWLFDLNESTNPEPIEQKINRIML